ncbi:MAG: hypothetical protein P8163_19085 [Candidatus Thiodiazotropha sp.]
MPILDICTRSIIGHSSYPDVTITLDDLIEQADHALYLGKAYGKNQYVISNQT